MFIVKFVNGCGDHVSILVDAEEANAESLARKAIANCSARVRYLGCQELESITPFKVDYTDEQGTALLVESFNHEEDWIGGNLL